MSWRWMEYRCRNGYTRQFWRKCSTGTFVLRALALPRILGIIDWANTSVIVVSVIVVVVVVVLVVVVGVNPTFVTLIIVL